MDDEEDRREVGAIARARALACDVPAWQRVVRVEIGDHAAVFVYDDGRTWRLPGLQPV